MVSDTSVTSWIPFNPSASLSKTPLSLSVSLCLSLSLSLSLSLCPSPSLYLSSLSLSLSLSLSKTPLLHLTSFNEVARVAGIAGADAGADGRDMPSAPASSKDETLWLSRQDPREGGSLLRLNKMSVSEPCFYHGAMVALTTGGCVTGWGLQGEADGRDICGRAARAQTVKGAGSA